MASIHNLLGLSEGNGDNKYTFFLNTLLSIFLALQSRNNCGDAFQKSITVNCYLQNKNLALVCEDTNQIVRIWGHEKRNIYVFFS